MADSVKQFVHAAVLFVLLWRWQGGLSGFGMGRLVVKVAVASAACAAVCMVELHLGRDITHGVRLLVFVAISCSVGLATYFGALAALRTEELAVVTGRLRARLRRGR
jgi:peptidoglycan biosynthesis protein MviN/MurJ (putative lipid II flippase)